MIAIAGIFNQWVSDRVAKLQASAKVEGQNRLEKSEAELKETKAKTIRLEARLAPRALSETAWLAISERLLSFPGTQFQFASYQDDAEVKGLVMPMIMSLLKAGWKGLPAQEFLMVDLFEGVAVEYAPESEKTLGPAANALAESLNRNGIAARSVLNPELASRPDRLRIKVGKKPAEFQ